MKIIISTCELYLESTLPILINSLLDTGFRRDEILIAANSHKDEIGKFDGIDCHRYDTNIFEYVAFKACLAINEDMFTLHDTCRVLGTFKQSIDSFPLANFDSVSLANKHHGCGMGFYKHSFLYQSYNTINNMKHITKQDAVNLEGKFLGGNLGYFSENGPYTSEIKQSPYGTGIMRIEEHYDPPGIIKYKSNWGQTGSNYTLTL